jgi:hypothetical protein
MSRTLAADFTLSFMYMNFVRVLKRRSLKGRMTVKPLASHRDQEEILVAYPGRPS